MEETCSAHRERRPTRPLTVVFRWTNDVRSLTDNTSSALRRLSFPTVGARSICSCNDNLYLAGSNNYTQTCPPTCPTRALFLVISYRVHVNRITRYRCIPKVGVGPVEFQLNQTTHTHTHAHTLRVFSFSGDCSSRPDAPSCDQHSDELQDNCERDGREPADGGDCRAAAERQAETLSEMMMTSFGRCDDALCRAVVGVASHRTCVDYVSRLFAADTPAVRRCAFDLGRPCQLDASSTGVQFLTIDAVRVSKSLFVFV